MNLAAIMLEIRKLDADSIQLQSRLYDLEQDASRQRVIGKELHPAHAELLEGTRNTLAIVQRTLQRAKASL